MPEPAAELGLQLPVSSERHARVARSPDGARIYYEVGGNPNGPVLLMIRGLARSSAYWLTVRELLERDHRVIAFDNRGIGRSDCPRLPWSTRTMAADAAAVIEQSGHQRAHVFGISLGGMIAQELAIGERARVDRLILGCTTPGGRGAVRVSPRVALSLAAAGRLNPGERMRQTASMVLSDEFLAMQPEILDVWAAIANSEPSPLRGALFQLLAAAQHNAWSRLGRITARTLVVTGDADRLVPSANSERLAGAIRGAELKYLRGAGHDFPTERPEETAEIVAGFLG